MDNISAWFFKIANIRLIIGLVIIYLVFPLYLLPKIINSDTLGPLDLFFWYNHDTLYQMFENYGQAVRQRYLFGLHTIDLAYPIYYGTLLTILMAYIFKVFSIPLSKNMIFLPFMVVILDLIENSLLIYLLNLYPTKHHAFANLAGYATATKWVGFTLMTLFLLSVLVYGMRLRKMQNAEKLKE